MQLADDPRRLRALLALRDVVDESLEEAHRDRLALQDAMSLVLPRVLEATGARAVFVRSYGEDLALETFRAPAAVEIPQLVEVLERTGPGSEPFQLVAGDDLIVAQRLDVAGEWFGSAAFIVPLARAKGEEDWLEAALDIACEELDDFLFAIRASREKHRLMMELGEALRDRVLGNGIRRAVQVLSKAVPIRQLLLVCAGEDPSSTAHVQVYDGGSITFDTMDDNHAQDRAGIQTEARAYLERGDQALMQRFHFAGAREEVLINGITKAVVVGKVLVAPARGKFNTHDRELISAFGEFIRQRVVDFDKEWRALASCFRPRDVARLLSSDDYAPAYLTPREREVGILYVDIAGFTKLSEQVLKTPNRVAELVEAWSREAVHLVWSHGGVFDKMVGDCVIALFGPPFYDFDPPASLRAAIDCARAIRDMTTKFPSRPGFEHLAGVGLAVSTGVNLAPLFVGRCGPDANFTGFSSGMNNTARLQGCAERGEILVMSEGIARLGPAHGFSFGEERSAKVKNVAEPLRFRPLL